MEGFTHAQTTLDHFMLKQVRSSLVATSVTLRVCQKGYLKVEWERCTLREVGAVSVVSCRCGSSQLLHNQTTAAKHIHKQSSY